MRNDVAPTHPRWSLRWNLRRNLRSVGTIRGLVAVIVGAIGIFVLPTAGLASIAKYRGMHPVSPHAGGYCYIDVVHVHGKAPPDLRVYRVLPNQEHLFVGDEAALGYDGPSYGYFGPHPLTFPGLSTPEPIFCYLRGPHSHARKPEPAEKFVFKSDVYWFMGNFPPEFERDRHNLWINDSGTIAKYQRPNVDIAAAPPGYRFPPVAELPKPPIPVGHPAKAKAVKGAAAGTKRGGP